MKIEVTAPVGSTARANQAKHQCLHGFERMARTAPVPHARYTMWVNGEGFEVVGGFTIPMNGSVWTIFGYGEE